MDARGIKHHPLDRLRPSRLGPRQSCCCVFGSERTGWTWSAIIAQGVGMEAVGVRNGRFGLLRRDRDFRLLWIGNTVSLTGDAVSGIALPLVAIVVLGASAFQVGVLTTVVWVPQLVFGLPAGVWMDRVRRRPVMVAADLGRAMVVAAIPIAALAGVLGLWMLYVVAFTVGVLSMFFRLGWAAYLPSVVGRDRLVDATSTLEASGTAVGIAGPGLGGLLVQALSAPIALVLDAVSFLASAVNLLRIRTPEAMPEHAAGARLRHQLTDGLRFVRGQDLLLRLMVFFVLVSVVFAAQQAVLLVFLVRSVGLSPGSIGILLAGAAAGGVAGALVTPALSRRLGTARTFVLATGVTFPFGLFVPLTTRGAGIGWYLIGAGIVAVGIAVTNIVALTFLLTICPNELLGRVSAVANVTQTVGLVVGGLIGAALSELIGPRSAMWMIMGGLVAVAGYVIASPLRQIRNLPTESSVST